MRDYPNLDDIVGSSDDNDVEQIVGSVLADSNFDIENEVMKKLSYTRKVSINDIVPEEYQHKLMEIDFTMSQCYWLIGDIASDLVNSVDRERSKQLGRLISKQDIYEAVGFFCHRRGRSVRYYWEIANYFPVEVRKKYDVPFSIFAEARWVKDWELLLQIAEENPTWSGDRVRAEYHKVTGEIKSVRMKSEDKLEDNGVELPLPEEGEQWTGRATSRFRETLLGKLEHTVDDLRETINKIPLPDNIRIRIRDVILEVQDISVEIRREM